MSYTITVPQLMRIGAGTLSSAADVASRLGIRRPIVISDTFLAQSGSVDRLVDILARSGLSVAAFTETVPDPTTKSLQPALDCLNRHEADAVIGFGGGSPIDTAKALAVLAVSDEPMRSFKAPRDYGGPALPIMAIPTTAGSGSEATKFTVITDSETDEKMLCIGNSFLPTAAIVDYELTQTMPKRLSADTGIDALTHAVEAYVSIKANPFADALCLTAMQGVAKNLRRVYADGQDSEAREGMMLAATQAGIAFSNASVALIHGMSRPIGAHFRVAHGLSNAMLFPEVTRFSVDAAVGRYADCGRIMGLAGSGDSDNVAAGKFVDGIAELCLDLHVPTPAQYGIARAEWDRLVPTMAEQALASGSPSNNPLVPDVEQIVELYSSVYS